VQQNDIKRILAYSTLSQLGYMVMAAGLSAQPAAIFHLATHACFKALLFLGAGSVIHAMSQEQDRWKMGRLRDKMPVTALTFLLGTLALCGLPPLSGFYSKDAILAAAWKESPVLFGIGLTVAALTTFYMFRLVFVVFGGRAKSGLPAHAHESPRMMTYPLIALAVASVIAGVLGIQQFLDRQFFMAQELASPLPWWLVLVDNNSASALRLLRANVMFELLGPTGGWRPALWELRAEALEPFRTAPGVVLCGLGAVVMGFLGAWGLYRNAASDPLPEKLPALCRLLRNKFYFDEFYAWLIAHTQDLMARLIAAFDAGFLAGGVRFISGGTELFGRGLRLVQSGNLQTYAFLSAAGIALALYLMLRS
jgi:NADH-quinone oxidoreductase subunit L